jgi:hypothetical protein
MLPLRGVDPAKISNRIINFAFRKSMFFSLTHVFQGVAVGLGYAATAWR